MGMPEEDPSRLPEIRCVSDFKYGLGCFPTLAARGRSKDGAPSVDSTATNPVRLILKAIKG
jgi:hypothetical protein